MRRGKGHQGRDFAQHWRFNVYFRRPWQRVPSSGVSKLIVSSAARRGRCAIVEVTKSGRIGYRRDSLVLFRRGTPCRTGAGLGSSGVAVLVLLGPGRKAKAAAATGTIQDVQHVVMLMMENRSFDQRDNLFSGSEVLGPDYQAAIVGQPSVEPVARTATATRRD